MSATSAPSLARGTYSPSAPSDLRSPCPMINCLANHGYLPRDGRNIRLSEMKSALVEAGISTPLIAALSHAAYLERRQPGAGPQGSQSIPARIWDGIRNPWSIFLSRFGMRRPDQRDSMGHITLDLDQLSQHGIVEHDISLSRRDFAQGDNHSPRPDLIREILASSSDGGGTLTAQDFAELRRRRIDEQKRGNPALAYGPLQHQLGCGEIAFILNVLGDGKSVRTDYLRAFFGEERLPHREGWTRRRWWRMGLVELFVATLKVKTLVGDEVLKRNGLL